jgi:hypothetical protein
LEFAQSRVDLHGQTMRRCDGFCCGARPYEIARIDAFDRLETQTICDCPRLPATERGEFYVAMSLISPGGIPFGRAVADQRQFDRLADFF